MEAGPSQATLSLYSGWVALPKTRRQCPYCGAWVGPQRGGLEGPHTHGPDDRVQGSFCSSHMAGWGIAGGGLEHSSRAGLTCFHHPWALASSGGEQQDPLPRGCEDLRG